MPNKVNALLMGLGAVCEVSSHLCDQIVDDAVTLADIRFATDGIRRLGKNDVGRHALLVIACAIINESIMKHGKQMYCDAEGYVQSNYFCSNADRSAQADLMFG